MWSTSCSATGYTVTRNNEADEHNPGVWGDSEMIYIDPKTGTLDRRPTTSATTSAKPLDTSIMSHK